MNVFKKTLATAGIAAIIMGVGGVPAHAAKKEQPTPQEIVFDTLKDAKKGAGQATPVADSTLHKVAQNRANALAAKGTCKVSDNSNPFPSKPSGYLGGSQLQGTMSSGDYTVVTNGWLTGSRSVVLNSGYNHLGTGVAKDNSGCVYVVANYAKVQAPVVIAPKPVTKPKPAPKPVSKPKATVKPAPKTTAPKKATPTKKAEPTKKPVVKETAKPKPTKKAAPKTTAAPKKAAKPSKAPAPVKETPKPSEAPIAAPNTALNDELLTYKERVAKAEADRKTETEKRQKAEARIANMKSGAKDWSGYLSTGGIPLGAVVAVGALFIRRKPLEEIPKE